MAISRLSVTSWRTSRPRPAPMARRSAISRARTGARLVNSPATLAQATNSTRERERREHRDQHRVRRVLREPGLELGAHGEAAILVRVRVGALEIRGDRRQLGLRFRLRDAGLEASLDA